MTILRNVSLVAAICYAAVSQAGGFQQSRANAPFTLEITANGGPSDWDFANTADKIIKAGSPVEIAIRKTNHTDHEIAKKVQAGDRVGYQIELHDRRGNLLKPKPRDSNESNQTSGPIWVSGSKDSVLQFGESYIEHDFLSGHPFLGGYDLRRPGRYTVQVLEHVSNDPNSEVVKSNVIAIEVQASDSQ